MLLKKRAKHKDKSYISSLNQLLCGKNHKLKLKFKQKAYNIFDLLTSITDSLQKQVSAI